MQEEYNGNIYSRQQYRLEVEKGQIRFSDSDDIFRVFTTVSREEVEERINNHIHDIEDVTALPETLEVLGKVKTVEEIEPDDKGNVDIKEIDNEDIGMLFEDEQERPRQAAK